MSGLGEKLDLFKQIHGCWEVYLRCMRLTRVYNETWRQRTIASYGVDKGRGCVEYFGHP